MNKLNLYFCKMIEKNIVILFLILVYMCSIVLFIPIAYSTNDDLAIMSLIKGGYNTSFMSVILGFIINRLYLFSKDIEWYCVFLYVAHFISIFMFIKVLIEKEFLYKFRIVLILVFLVLYIRLLMGPSYNNSSLLVGANTLLLFLSFLNNRKISLRKSFFLGCFFSISYMIRTEMVIYLLLLSFPLFLLSLRKNNITKVLIFLMPTIILMVINGIILLNAGMEQKKFDEFNAARGKISDSAISDHNIGNDKILTINKWSNFDYVKFELWFYQDENKYNTEKMVNFMKYANKVNSINFNEFISNSKKFFQEEYKVETNILIMLIIQVLIFNRLNRKNLMLILYYVFFMLGFNHFFRMPPRIAVPSFIIIYTSLIFFAEETECRIKLFEKKILRYLFSLIIIFSILLIVFQTTGKRIDALRKNRDYTKKCVEIINQKYSKSTFVNLLVPYINLKLEYLDPFRAEKLDFNAVNGGWLIFSPLFYKQIKEYLGAEKGYEVIPKMAENSRCYFISIDDIAFNIVPRAINFDYDGKYYVEKVESLHFYENDQNLGIYRISKR